MHFVYMSKIICILTFIYVCSCNKDLPPNWPHCYRDLSKEKLDACLLKATELVKPFLKAGVPALRIPSLEKFTIPEISLEQGTDNSNFKASLKDILLHGISDYVFNKYSFDKDTLHFSLDLDLPYLYLKGKFITKGKLFEAPLEGQGDFFANVTNTKVTMEIDSKIVKRKGVEFLIHSKYNSNLKVGKIMDYDVVGLFADNPVLAKATRTVIKENLSIVIEEIKPAIEKVMVKIAEELVLDAFHRIPYDNLYPVHK